MKRQSAPRWLVGLCCVLAAVAVVLALVLGNVILARRQRTTLVPPASPSPTSHPASVQPEPDSPSPEEEESEPAFHTLGSVLLYCIQDNLLEYDAVHTISVEHATVIDLTGAQIASLSQLTAVLDEQTWAFTADLILDTQGQAAAVCLTERTLRPKIGISWESDDQDLTSYKKDIQRNGGIPVELPQITDDASAVEALSQVDGVWLTGGGDIDPAFYGEEVDGSYHIDPVRDISDYHLAQQAIRLDVPLLAICRGEQVLNVALGGGLIQDINDYLEENDLPSADETGVYHKNSDMPYHDINQIDPDSKWLSDIVGGTTLTNAATYHHQAIDPDRVAPGLIVVAWSDDGMIEAVEYQANRFALGVQFHPERDALGDTTEVDVDQDICNQFFRFLIAAAAGN
ncbi:MAG: gamma-glutamyl-gamma-aminobutyrate hydrolase family protein [Candidatus Onthomonas sp.]